jgi:pimeloyl-ACP methyl ester carboxylesterase
MNIFEFEGHKIAFVDEGHGPAVVFVHGTPSSSAEFHGVISSLQNDYRCIAIDHLGFGASEKPENGDYSLQKHTERLAALLAFLKLTRFHLVVHDFGGAIGLPIAVNNWEGIQSLTLMNTWGWPLVETESSLKKQKWLMNSGFMRFLYKKFNFSARFLVKMAWGKHRPLTREKHLTYQNAFPTPAERMGTVGFLNALFETQNPAWKVHQELASKPKIPVLLLWGKSDVISLNTLNRWKVIFPHSGIELFEKVGHFVADEAPELVTKELRLHFEGLRHREST